METLTATPATAPVETVTPLRPSEAMRLGCLIVPRQTTSQLFDDITVTSIGWDPSNAFGRPVVAEVAWEVGSACALGAMAIGFGQDPRVIGQAGYWWPEGQLRELPYLTCPAGPGDGCDDELRVFYVVSHLNDIHDWKRERIADWLEGLGL